MFLLLANLERMQQGDAHIRRIVVSGGIGQLDGLCQHADLSGLSVYRPELHEATALGAARLAGGILGMAPPTEAEFGPRE